MNQMSIFWRISSIIHPEEPKDVHATRRTVMFLNWPGLNRRGCQWDIGHFDQYSLSLKFFRFREQNKFGLHWAG